MIPEREKRNDHDWGMPSINTYCNWVIICSRFGINSLLPIQITHGSSTWPRNPSNGPSGPRSRRLYRKSRATKADRSIKDPIMLFATGLWMNSSVLIVLYKGKTVIVPRTRELRSFLLIFTWLLVGGDGIAWLEVICIATKTTSSCLRDGSNRSHVSAVLFSLRQRRSVWVEECDRLNPSVDHVWNRRNLRHTRKMPSSFSIGIRQDWILHWTISRRGPTSLLNIVYRAKTQPDIVYAHSPAIRLLYISLIAK